ncbi:AAA family ATPase [Kushneria sp. TE3]|uniref:AAA family ATPase n=1 Tax=Kushneria sp. TE3 TaxID=3449832 RepID=UPI003F68252A
MITQINMNAVASFKQAISFETDKRINLIYGLNGTGKSTISNFLYQPDDPSFALCSKKQNQTAPVLVYNQKFVRDHFFVADSLKGIFSLSKENKEAEQIIHDSKKRDEELKEELHAEQAAREQEEKSFFKQKQQAIDSAWNIKKKYAGGDRVLEYCLENLKGQKEKLFDHLKSISKPTSEPVQTIEEIKKKVETLKSADAQPQQRLVTLSFQAHDVELDELLMKSILGNSDSEVADLIEQLGNADWVKQGVNYLPDNLDSAEFEVKCPFCQELTITNDFIENIKKYFDVSYQNQIQSLNKLLEKYSQAIDALPKIEMFTDHASAQEHKDTLSDKYNNIEMTLRENIRNLKDKIETPKQIVLLINTRQIISDFNKEIIEINQKIDDYNKSLYSREASLKELKGEFWSLMRWQYDQTISRYEKDEQASVVRLNEIDENIARINTDIIEVENEIRAAQQKTVNVDAAVDAINAGLLDLGIDGFSLKKHSESLYRVVRAGESSDAFHSLSEGEKMMISFLYFCELYKGLSSAKDSHRERIIVIDDPISSLSHIFVFNIGQLIRSVFFRGDRCRQVIILTHSLYFFYELTDTNHQRRSNTQKLFRLSKPSSGSVVQEMSYEEIQNDYQAYWSVVNDRNQPSALIANCIRNIIEYFFGFVRKKDLNNVFQMAEFQDNKYQAFCRYINRESHSLGQNVIDTKEFDYDVFKDGLRLVFEKAGYPEHFDAMSRC